MSRRQRRGKERSRVKSLRRRKKAFSFIATLEGTEQGPVLARRGEATAGSVTT